MTTKPDGEFCGSCKFFIDAKCRRLPPQIFMSGMERASPASVSYQTTVNWPATAMTDWCGDWKAAENGCLVVVFRVLLWIGVIAFIWHEVFGK